MNELTYPSFLESDMDPPLPENAKFHILPVPYEKSTSYGEGTVRGPSAILNASQQLELFDGHSIPAEEGIYTHLPVDCDLPEETVLAEIAEQIGKIHHAGHIPVMLGGEHTVTYGAIKALHDAGEKFGIIQFDAHADLRSEYEGTKWSHACVMRRAVEMGIPLCQIGVRSLSLEDLEIRVENAIMHYDMEETVEKGLDMSLVLDNFPEKVYVTFDVDALDPSIMPGTGTPEPGGMQWYPALKILNHIARRCEVIGFDVVEVSPMAGSNISEFTAARLAYNFMGMIARRE
ncbi:MAG TPA: agmatinase [Kiritimatiellia bacterium]|nr:agmatinase [Kiritimatiellia bacterium]HNS80697.1 agmatinase [Kiritimatiellia bacterium]HPA78236.1 agmatinase [Kiritimatiellia bacterium]HQQ04942.1 agmatinase [Kiritimatiellia bacterium]